ncbi:MAG: glutamate synthase-related protein [Wenzhouxiangella sp.]|jgi:glutamate synthase domain-containing protein 2|nr:glutamate synthase-related protein [Wenzhouxiangella sp.]
MSQPVIADNKPTKVSLEKGKKYAFCRCGRSSDQPFCDGSHKGTDITPKMFTAEKDETAYLCQCKHTGDAPYCDGTHKKFSDDQVGKEAPARQDEDRGETSSDENKEEDKNAPPEPEATPEEPTVEFIHQLAREGLKDFGAHGPTVAMGVPKSQLPQWDQLQLMVAQLSVQPLMEDEIVATDLVIGPEAKQPLNLKIPLFVTDMSFGALSPEAKIALAKGAEMVGTGICSGEGGMLPEEQAENSRYFFELASAGFGYSEDVLTKVQAFHFKAGQAAKTGVGGLLPGSKVTERIAKVRGISEGEDAHSPAAFKDLKTAADFRRFADRVREVSGGIPVGFKISANHIERDIQFALDAGADYIILDGRGGGTGASPAMFRDHISVPTIPALARARRYLDDQHASGRVTLIATGGLRTPIDFVKALALGADGIALGNSAIQAVGCVGARICHTNNCPTGVATQREDLRKRLNVDHSAERLKNFFEASVSLMQVMARACGHHALSEFNRDDLATWDRDMALLAGVRYAGVQGP